MKKFIDYIMAFFKFSDGNGKQSQNSRITQSSFKNLTAKILAVLIAVGLWLHVMNEQNPLIEARYTIPLEIRNMPPNYVIVDYPDSIRTRIRGPRILVAGTSSKDIKAYVDMNGMSEGRHNVSISSIVPSPLELVENTPETVFVRLEPIITRNFPVSLEFSGVLPNTVNIGKVTAKLTQASVKGPKYLVDTIDKLVGVIDVSGKTASFSIEAELTPIGRNGFLVEGLTVSPDSTTAKVDIEIIAIKKTVDIKPVFDGNLPPGVALREITLEPAKLEIKDETGENKAALEKVEYISTEPIKLAELTHDTKKNVKLILPEGLTSETMTTVANIRLSRQ